MRAVSQTQAVHREARRAAVVVEHPLLRVVEVEETADPGAVADALEVLVKWAVRAHRRCNPSMEQDVEIAKVNAICAGDPS